MYKIRIVFIWAALFSMQPAFAVGASGVPADSSGDKPCATIANACLAAGFVRTETPGKEFWQSCMKPVILGQNVDGVTVDSTTVKACRVDKIKELKAELKDLQKASK